MLRSARLALAGAALLAALTTTSASAAELYPDEHLYRVRPSVSTRGDNRFVRPVAGWISAPFGERGPYWRVGYHPGIDFAVRVGTPVKAVADGVVIEAENEGWNRGYGSYVKVDHGRGLHSLYAHLSKIHVLVGDRIETGEVLARSGNTGFSTGPHLHFEIRQNGVHKDPAVYLGFVL